MQEAPQAAKTSNPAVSAAPDSAPGWGSIIGGVALVGAAAGYAALAFSFRHFGSSASNARRFAAGSAEMRFSENISREWERSGATMDNFRTGGGWREREREAFEADNKWKREGAEFRARAEQAKQRFEAHFGSEGGGRSEGAQPGSRPSSQLASAYSELRIPSANWASVTAAEAKEAYRVRAKETHPDAGGSSADETAFKRIAAAYDTVLQDIKRRS